MHTTLRAGVRWLIVLLLACSSSSVAAEGGVEHKPGLNWVRLSGAEACIAAAELVQRVEARLGRSLFAAARDAKLFVDGYVARSAQGFAVTLEVSERDGRVLGRRTLQFAGDDCSVIIEAVTLVIAVTLYPDSALPFSGIPLEPGTAADLDALFARESAELDPASLPQAPAAAPAPPTHGREAAPAAVGGGTPRSKAPFGLTLAGAPTLGFGQLPGLAAGAAAYATLRPWPDLSIEAGFVYFPARSVRAEVVRGEAQFALWLGSLAVCPLRPAGWDTFDVCFGAEAGSLYASASEFLFVNQRGSEAVLNLRASGVWSVTLAGPLLLRMALSLSVPILQHNYTFRGPDNAPVSLFRMPQASLRAEVGLGVTF